MKSEYSLNKLATLEIKQRKQERFSRNKSSVKGLISRTAPKTRVNGLRSMMFVIFAGDRVACGQHRPRSPPFLTLFLSAAAIISRLACSPYIRSTKTGQLDTDGHVRACSGNIAGQDLYSFLLLNIPGNEDKCGARVPANWHDTAARSLARPLSPPINPSPFFTLETRRATSTREYISPPIRVFVICSCY